MGSFTLNYRCFQHGKEMKQLCTADAVGMNTLHYNAILSTDSMHGPLSSSPWKNAPNKPSHASRQHRAPPVTRLPPHGTRTSLQAPWAGAGAGKPPSHLQPALVSLTTYGQILMSQPGQLIWSGTVALAPFLPLQVIKMSCKETTRLVHSRDS